uniref:Uncharacterized protein n=1 Tax=Anguilla anguilla TaxID=7936 RepID=A0A0E9Q6K4_ANGAN
MQPSAHITVKLARRKNVSFGKYNFVSLRLVFRHPVDYPSARC